MHPAEIKAALELKGYSQVRIAQECGVQRATVNQVISGRGRSSKVENRIATVLRKSRGDIWPQWYPEEVSHSDVKDAGPLSEDELELLRVYRALPLAQKAQARGMLEVFRLGGSVGTSAIKVSGKGSRVAGRDYHEGTKR